MRGGEAPSPKLSPSQTLLKWDGKETNLFEKGIKGMSIFEQPKPDKTFSVDKPTAISIN